MPIEKILPTVLIVIDWIAVIPYVIQGNYSLALYWFGCGLVTLAVTWL